MSCSSPASPSLHSPMQLPALLGSPLQSPLTLPTRNILAEFPLLFLESVSLFLCHLFKSGGLEAQASTLQNSLHQEVRDRRLNSTQILLTIIYLHRLLHLNPLALKTYSSVEEVLCAAICLSQENTAGAKPPSQTLTSTSTATSQNSSSTLSAHLRHSTSVDDACLLQWRRCLEQKVQKLRILEERRDRLKAQRKASDDMKSLPMQLTTARFLSVNLHDRGVEKSTQQAPSSSIGSRSLGGQQRASVNLLASAWIASQLQQQQQQRQQDSVDPRT